MSCQPDPMMAQRTPLTRLAATPLRDFHSSSSQPTNKRPEAHVGGLIINADDWGRDRETTDRIVECCAPGAVSAVSAMVFMQDSERATALAGELAIDVGLHLNFTSSFSAKNCPAALAEHQHRVSGRLLSHRLAQTLFYPGLMKSFEYLVSAQLDEFNRLYGRYPQRLDGHHHMHLCGNVLLGGLLPSGTSVRRSFSFQPGDKSLANRLYRRAIDRILMRRHRVTDFFFSLAPLEPAARLRRIFDLASRFAVEVETHPVNRAEHQFFTAGQILRRAHNCTIAPNPV